MSGPLGEEGKTAAVLTGLAVLVGAVIGAGVGYLAMVETPEPVVYGNLRIEVSEVLKPVLLAILGGLTLGAVALRITQNTPAHDTVHQFGRRRS